MSVQTLYTAATGMQAMETKLDVIANNLANVNTTGFKASSAKYSDSFAALDAIGLFPDALEAEAEIVRI